MLGSAGIFAPSERRCTWPTPSWKRPSGPPGLAYLADDGVASPDGTPDDSDLQWPGTELEHSALFTDVRQSLLVRRFDCLGQDYVGHLSTISAYLQLPVAEREVVLDRSPGRAPDRVALVADLTLHLARRV